jgi:hypothetical protein
MLSWLVPQRHRNAWLGDLAEEYARRSRVDSALAAVSWYVREICASAPPLLWLRLTQTSWISSAGVAFLAYAAIGLIEATVNWAMASFLGMTVVAYNPLGMFITFPMVVLIGYIAAGFGPGAPIMLAAMMVVSVTAMTLWASESMPIWFRIAYFLVGPAATLIGSRLRSLRPGGGDGAS